MDVGFETIGNATLICYDRVPILVTDPWLDGSAYFGSWTFSHHIPDQQMEAIKKSQYVWVSHGHPDHLSSKSIRTLDAKKILLPDHVGRRIFNSLREQGYDVQVLQDRTWTKLSVMGVDSLSGTSLRIMIFHFYCVYQVTVMRI
jgi:L-ascorbate metabolism protein UlaG (beta-lactamase superfamily)